MNSEYIEYQEVKYRHRIFQSISSLDGGWRRDQREIWRYNIYSQIFKDPLQPRIFDRMMHNKNLFEICDDCCIADVYFCWRALESDFIWFFRKFNLTHQISINWCFRWIFTSLTRCTFEFNIFRYLICNTQFPSMILQNWIEIESVDFPNRLYPHRWTMKIHFYFISLSWNMFYNIFIRTREEIKNIQSCFPLSCFYGGPQEDRGMMGWEKKQLNGKKFNNNVSDIWKTHEKDTERLLREVMVMESWKEI